MPMTYFLRAKKKFLEAKTPPDFFFVRTQKKVSYDAHSLGPPTPQWRHRWPFYCPVVAFSQESWRSVLGASQGCSQGPPPPPLEATTRISACRETARTAWRTTAPGTATCPKTAIVCHPATLPQYKMTQIKTICDVLHRISHCHCHC